MKHHERDKRADLSLLDELQEAAMLKKQKPISPHAANIEECKDIFVPWKMLGVMAFGIIATSVLIGIGYTKEQNAQNQCIRDNMTAIADVQIKIKTIDNVGRNVDTIKAILRAGK